MNRFRLTFISIVILTSSVFMLVGCTQKRDSADEVQPTPVLDPTVETHTLGGASPVSMIEETWGIRIESAMLSAVGYMVDFRFRVLDAAKAMPIFERKSKPCLIDQATGAAFAVPNPPKVGPLRSGGHIKEGKVYFIFFANPAKYVKSGNKVTVVIGDFRAQDVVIQ